MLRRPSEKDVMLLTSIEFQGSAVEMVRERFCDVDPECEKSCEVATIVSKPKRCHMLFVSLKL